MAPRGRYVTGQEEIRRRFLALPAAMMAEIETALDKGAQEIASAARTLAPKDTGELAASIEVRRDLTGFKARGATGNFARLVRGQNGEAVRYIGVFPRKRGSPGWYAAWVEFGATARPAQPFLRPAFWTRRKRVQGRVNRAIRRVAKQAAQL